MPSGRKTTVVYVTKSDYKKRENEIFTQNYKLANQTPVHTLFEFDIREVDVKEVLEVDLATMVSAEVIQAYSMLKVPCIVEHAGLIFDDYLQQSYPGGLTKPMWNALGDKFISETHSAGRRAIARAVVAYCDGKTVHTFVGETQGELAPDPRGSAHHFYWDTVFMPDDPTGKAKGKTYAEIVEDPKLGLKYKMVNLSQSSRAMSKFLDYLLQAGPPSLWGRFP